MRIQIGNNLKQWVSKGINYTANPNENIILTTNNLQITLPTNPADGDTLTIINGTTLPNCFVTILGNILNVVNRSITLGSQVNNVELVYDGLVGYWAINKNIMGSGQFNGLAVGWMRTLAIKGADGSCWAWGDNTDGQLGNNSKINTSSPISVLGGNSYVRIATGMSHSLAIRGDGTAWAWGLNGHGQLGNNSRTSYSSPISVWGGNSYVRIMTGISHSLAIRIDGTAWAWGQNTQGQLGNNSIVSASSPISVFGDRSYTEIAAYYYSCYGISTTDGSIWSWGGNAAGQLGQNTTTGCSTPIQVVGTNSYTKISAGTSFCIAISGINGTIWSWGYNGTGQLGTNNTTSYSSPVQICNAISYSKIEAGYDSCMALKGSDGMAWSWGNNNLGQLGTNNTTSYSSPVSIIKVASYTNIAMGYKTAFVIKSDNGTTWGWGQNNVGQLGNASTTNTSSLVLVVG